MTISLTLNVLRNTARTIAFAWNHFLFAVIIAAGNVFLISQTYAHPDRIEEIIGQRKLDKLRPDPEKKLKSKYLTRGTRFYGSPVHEEMTIHSLKLSGILDEPFSLKKHYHFIRGVFWNDDPTQELWPESDEELADTFGVIWGIKFLNAKNCASGCNGNSPKFYTTGDPLIGRSHFGDMQFLHAMAEKNGIEAQATQDKIMIWVEFAYKVATGELTKLTLINDVPIPGIRKLFVNDKNILYGTIENLFGSDRVKEMAAGTILHIIQDSFAGGHAERIVKHATLLEPFMKGKIKKFHSYLDQNSSLHSKADELPVNLNLSMARNQLGEDPISHGAAALELMFKNSGPTDWLDAKGYFLSIIFPIANKLAKSGPGERFRKVTNTSRDEGTPRLPRKRALLVGVDNYLSPEVSDLAGTVNDALAMKFLLQSRYRFKDKDIRVLVNEQATRDEIIRLFRSHLIDGAVEGDTLVFHFSGHGSQMKAPTGSEESDGWDETIVAYDSRHGDTYDITDNEIAKLIEDASAKTKNLTLIIDACHSGTAARNLGPAARWIKPDDRTAPPAIRPPLKSWGPRGITSRSTHVYDSANPDYVLISGSRSSELSYEYTDPKGQIHGALSYFLIQELLEQKSPETFLTLMDKVSAKVTGVYPQQHPQIEGRNKDNFVFDTKSAPASLYLTAEANAEGNYVIIKGGRASNVTKGSVFALYRPNIVTFGPEVRPLALAKITIVDEFSAKADITKGTVVSGVMRAVLKSFSYEDFKIRIKVDGPSNSLVLQKIRDKLTDGTFEIAITATESTSINLRDVFELTYSGLPQIIVREERGRVGLEDIAGRRHNIPKAASDTNATLKETIDALLNMARWYKTLETVGTGKDLDIDVKFKSARIGQSIKETAEGIEIGPQQLYKVVIHNKSPVPNRLFFGILSMDYDGTIKPLNLESLYGPEPEIAFDRVGAGVEIPANFQTAHRFPGEELNDIAYLKFFFADRPVNLKFYSQSKSRALGGCGDLKSAVAVMLCRMNVTGGQTRSFLIPIDRWKTITKRITVRSK